MRDLEIIFKALADETRVKILGLLSMWGELCVCDFVEVLQISQSKASRHLRYLANAGLLEDRKEALWVHYRIVRQLDSNRQAVVRLVRNLCKDRLTDLEDRLEEWRRKKIRNAAKHSRGALCRA